ncbi:MAG: 2-amino-4-hydroxy-6-hydroxymethyldihydropteridine diphosphokinase [Alphaproteobacteria bacterium]|nr:2-amino-4-hydroxy-6-hydroxymethyldihydropteridine diphosphokinase [Alphaproteobacteria bacterium]
MILIALGANLASRAGPPLATLQAALRRLPEHGIAVAACSPFYQSAPVPASDQPAFVNAVARVETTLPPEGCLAALLAVEREFGRERRARWAARTLDLDLIDHEGRVLQAPGLTLPHPEAKRRAFVLVPLRDVAPDWRDPVSGVGIAALIEALPAETRRPPALAILKGEAYPI